MLLHGWPGSFLEMLPLIDLLRAGDGEPAFDVVIPSLPGFGFSSNAPEGWTVNDTARVLNKLMDQVLGYKTFTVHGTDWGAGIGWIMYDQFNATVRALHLNVAPFVPLLPEQLVDANITLNTEEQGQEKRLIDWSNGGNGYFIEQAKKVIAAHYRVGVSTIMT